MMRNANLALIAAIGFSACWFAIASGLDTALQQRRDAECLDIRAVTGLHILLARYSASEGVEINYGGPLGFSGRAAVLANPADVAVWDVVTPAQRGKVQVVIGRVVASRLKPKEEVTSVTVEDVQFHLGVEAGTGFGVDQPLEYFKDRSIRQFVEGLPRFAASAAMNQSDDRPHTVPR